MITAGQVFATLGLVALSIGLVVTVGRLFYLIVIEELWPAHGWKLFKHPTLKPGARVVITKGHWSREGQVGTIEKQVYQSTFKVLLDGEPESLRFYKEEMELVPPSAKAYEELFL
jgi:hypothetical protein